MTEKVTVAFAGGGTGGHIYPGLAVADSLREYAVSKNIDVEICWIGSSNGTDKTIVEKNVDARGVRSADVFYAIPAGKLRRYFSLENLIDVFKIFAGFFASLAILGRIKPALLFSKGGFVSVPPCAAARVLGIPVFTHESDFTPGLATKLNSASAKKIFVSAEETVRYLGAAAQKKAVVTGNPVRPVFYSASKERGLAFLGLSDSAGGAAGTSGDAGASAGASAGSSAGAGDESQKPLLVVVGGSSGALQINNLVRENLAWLCERFVVVHQTGKNAASFVGAAGAVGGATGATGASSSASASASANSDAAEATSASASASAATSASASAADYKPYEFIYSEMPDVLCAADVILSRAGANSLWECAALAKPLVLIPLCGSGTRGDQEDNAQYFAERGAAIVLDREDANSKRMRAALTEMLDADKRKRFAESCGAVARGERAVEKIAKLLLDEICGGKKYDR